MTVLLYLVLVAVVSAWSIDHSGLTKEVAWRKQDVKFMDARLAAAKEEIERLRSLIPKRGYHGRFAKK